MATVRDIRSLPGTWGGIGDGGMAVQGGGLDPGYVPRCHTIVEGRPAKACVVVTFRHANKRGRYTRLMQRQDALALMTALAKALSE